MKESQKKANNRYRKEKVKRFMIDFYGTDTEIWEHLQSQDNKQGFLKELIRKDMREKP